MEIRQPSWHLGNPGPAAIIRLTCTNHPCQHFANAWEQDPRYRSAHSKRRAAGKEKAFLMSRRSRDDVNVDTSDSQFWGREKETGKAFFTGNSIGKMSRWQGD
jgi:hypothetical protein